MANYPSMHEPARAAGLTLAVDIKEASVLRPGRYFGLGHKSSLATLATVITYGIILMQFRDAGF